MDFSVMSPISHATVNACPVANAADVDAVVYDTVGGTKRWQGTVSITGGGVVIDNNAVGEVDDQVFLVLRWLVANARAAMSTPTLRPKPSSTWMHDHGRSRRGKNRWRQVCGQQPL